MATAQQRAAFERGNQHRSERHKLLRRLHGGEIDLAEVLADPPACVNRMPVHELLIHLKWMGPIKVRALNVPAARAGVNLFRPVGELTPLHREWILEQILPRASRRGPRHVETRDLFAGVVA